MDTNEVVDFISQGNNIEAKQAIEDILSTKAFQALEDMKQDIGRSMFDGESD